MAHQVTHTICPVGPGVLCQGQLDRRRAAVSGAALAHWHDQYADPYVAATPDALSHQQIGQQIQGHLAAWD